MSAPPANDQISRLEPRYSLKQAVAQFFSNGPLTVASLRTEIRKGHLRVERVAGKVLVTEAAVAEMLEKCEQCLARAKPLDSTLDGAKVEERSGPSSTARLKLAQAAANSITAELQKPSPNTARKNMSLPVPFRRENCGSPR